MAMLDPPLKILLIEDNPGDARLIREMLADSGAQDITIECVSRLSQGLEYLDRGKIDLVLLDLDLPDSHGLDTFLKASAHAPGIPFVLLTGLDDESLALTAVQKGAQDYLIKGKTNGSRLFQAVRYAAERKKGQEALQQAHDELERRVEERTAELVAANRQLEEEIAKHRQTDMEQQRLLAELQNYSEELRIANEDLQIQAEELGVQNETLNLQAEELENLTGELETGRNLLQAVLEQMPAGVIIAEPSGRIILSNRRAETIWQQPAGAMTNLENFRQMPRYYLDGRPYLSNDLPLRRSLTLGENVVDEEQIFERQDGDTVHLNVNATPVRDQHGSIIAAVATYTDITARKQAQAALRQSEERYRSLVELSPDAIVVHIKGKMVFVNPAAVKLFGATVRGDLIGQPLLDRIHPAYHELSRDCARKIRSGREIGPQEEKILRLDGEAVEVEIVGSGIMYQGRPAIQVVLRDITEKKRAREALRAANANLQALIEASPLAIVHLDWKGTIQSCNPETERIFGWRGDELLGRSLPVVSKAKQKEVQNTIQRVLQGEPVTGEEVRARRKDGDWIDVSISVAPMYDGIGQITGIVGLVEDITARKVAEAALKESQRQTAMLADFLENSSQPFVVGSLDGRIGMVNEAFLQLMGYSQKELSKLNWEKDLTPPEWREKEAAKVDELQRTGQPVRYEKEYVRKDGSRVPVELFLQVRRDEHSQPIYYAFVTDITARKEAEAALQESEERYRSLFEANHAVMLLVNPDTAAIVDANPAACSFYGFSREELTARKITDLNSLPPKDVVAAMQKARDDQQRRFQFRHRLSGGEIRDVEVFSGAIRIKGQDLLYSIVHDITARNEAEAALQESEALFRGVFEGAPISIALVDFEGQILKTNPALHELLGYERFELEGKNVADITYPDDLQKDFDRYREIVTGKVSRYDLEKRYVCKDGKLVWGHLAISSIRDAAGVPKFAIGMVENISARKQAEEALKQERQRLFDLLDTLPGLIFLHGEDYSIRFANKGFRETFGDPNNRLCYEIFHKRNTRCEICPAPPIIENQTPRVLEQYIDGRTYQVYKYPFRDIDGSRCVLSMGLDITDQKRAEEALRESEEKFRQLAENLDDAILLASADMRRVHYVSPAYERIWGRSCASLYSEPSSWLETVAPEDREKVRIALKELIAGDLPTASFPEFRIIRPDGAVRWILVRFFPIRNEAGETHRIAGTATDITGRKEMETVLKWREEHLQQTAKMEAVARLAGGVAHDFNNLLTVISGYGELLLADLGKTDPASHQVQAILKAADQATAVTRQLLAFSRKQVLQLQILDLSELIANLVEMFSRLVDENIKIAVKLDPEQGAVKADPSQMEQVVMNLAINALDAMPAGGTLTIETANVQVGYKDAKAHPGIVPGDYVVVSVRDTGIGMNREVLSHIFEPFFTTKEKGKGTGLGLSMAYGIIKQSGGHIRVESSPGKGSNFRIYLPCVLKAKRPTAIATPDFVETRGTGTILLVEDEEGVRHVVRRMLALKGYSVLSAHDGREALAIGQSHPGPINLLLTDVAMPAMGGRELAERLTLVHPEMKVLFMSGHTEDAMLRRGVRESAINFIQKPFRADQLLHKIGELLAESKP
jgi:two-component system cell cycle sensor histidine kinase/response regulator CckA